MALPKNPPPFLTDNPDRSGPPPNLFQSRPQKTDGGGSGHDINPQEVPAGGTLHVPKPGPAGGYDVAPDGRRPFRLKGG